MKKIHGKIHYIGRWGRRVDGKLVRIEGDGPDSWWKPALAEYLDQKDDLYAGRPPHRKGGGLTVADLCNHFLTSKQRKRDSGELGLRMFTDYKEITDILVREFGKTRFVDDLAAEDFEALRAKMTKNWGPVRLGNAITRIKSVFKYGLDNGLLDKPVRFGSEFRKPDKAVLRRHKAQSGAKMLETDELRRLIEAAGVPLRAMILLGLNAGFGNNDVASLPLAALDLERGWLNYPRPKTGIARRCPLWPETVAALREALASRPAPKSKADEDIALLQPSGRRWVRVTEKSRTDNVSVCFTDLMKSLDLHRDGLGFYTLRHVFRTVADAARDPVAIDLIMGHSDPSMGGHYRERVEDSRLEAVTDHVRQWLFGEDPDDGTTGEAEGATPELGEGCDPDSPHQDDETDARPALRLYVG
jgi:integrase